MTLPNFLVIGAAKAGTSSLAAYLKQHPQVYLNEGWKELRFFAYDGHPPESGGPGDRESNLHTTTTLADYEAYFADAAGEPAIGEVSPVYLYSDRAPERIHHYIPHAKLIAVLRNPVDRAWSHYLHLVRDGREMRTFERGLALEEERIRKGYEWSWHYRRVGLYHDQLARYYRTFDRSQILVLLYDDLVKDPAAFLATIFRFVDVDDTFAPMTAQRHNTSGLPHSLAVARGLMGARRIAKRALDPLRPYVPDRVWYGGSALLWAAIDRNRRKPPLAPATRRALIDSFRDDIQRLEELIDRDLSHWIEAPTERAGAATTSEQVRHGAVHGSH